LILEIELEGAAQVKRIDADAVMFFVVPPSRQVQAERLRRRGEPEETVQARLAKAAELEARGRQLADHVVVNEDLDHAVAEVAGILEEHRQRRPPRLENPNG